MNGYQKIKLAFLSLIITLIMPADFVLAEAKSQEAWQKTCEQVKNMPFPVADRPSPKDARELVKCDPYDLYYGFQENADPAKARLCAYVEMDHPWIDGPFDGKAMLMTIYANGIGAKRNLDLALKLACEIGGAPAEIEGRIKHLEELKAKNWQGKDFSLCDDITSGYMQGFCADHTEKFESVKREGKLSSIQAKWTKTDKKEFAALSKAAYRYFDVHAENEVEQSGTARAALFIEDKAAQEEDFIKTLEALAKKTLPQYSDQQFKEADAQLNAGYQKVQKNFNAEYGTITKEGIKITQRAWIKYRDAFVKFCLKKYPDNTGSIKTHLTLKRIEELKEFIAQ